MPMEGISTSLVPYGKISQKDSRQPPTSRWQIQWAPKTWGVNPFSQRLTSNMEELLRKSRKLWVFLPLNMREGNEKKRIVVPQDKLFFP